MADLDADLRRQPALRRGGREVDLAEAALSDEAVQPVRATGLGAMGLNLLRHATYLPRVRAAVKPTNLPYALTASSRAFASTRLSARLRTVSMRTEFRSAVGFQCPISRPSSSTALKKGAS